MADQSNITSTSNGNTSNGNTSNGNTPESNTALLVVRELDAHLRHMESHLATLSNLARVAVKAQTRTMGVLERDMDALLTMIKQGRQQALRHFPDGEPGGAR